MAQPDPSPSAEGPDGDFPGPRVLLWLTFAVLIAGILTGFIGGTFRWLLVRTDARREELAEWAQRHGFWGLLVPIAVSAAAAAAAAAIAGRWPQSAGSGIQQVEAVEHGQDAPTPPSTLFARYSGGLLSIGVAGMVLGREGPTVHMGAASGAIVGRMFRAARDEIRVMQTVLSGAGLAVAFNAPIGGAIFVFEEVARTVRLRAVLWTLVAVGAAITCSRLVLGDHRDFAVAPVTEPGLEALPLFAVFGVCVGLLGVGYNWMVDHCLTAFQAVRALPAVAKAALIGAVIGAALVYLPEAVGGGDTVTQSFLDGRQAAFATVVLFLALRFCTGPISYAAGTPGGLFAPMLALGTLAGVVFARVVEFAGVDLVRDTEVSLMIAGMAALFAAAVRAPFTGIVLVMEMTAATGIAIPMVVAAATAVMVASLAHSDPVYDTLRERMLADRRRADDEPPGR